MLNKSTIFLLLLFAISGAEKLSVSLHHDEKRYQEKKVEDNNTVKVPLKILLATYQTFISPHDGSNCQFSPSCSHYSQDAISETGPIQGLLMTGDRVLRCNGMGKEKYKVHADQIHIIDQASDNILWKRDKK